jgi:hypothetical protein
MNLIRSTIINSNIEFIDEYCKIPLINKNKEIIDYTLVDKDDSERVLKHAWSISITKKKVGNYKYACTRINGKTVRLSHFIFGKPKGKNVIDHINNNALDNRKLNLQSVSRSHNSQNREKTTNESSSKYIGVYYHKTNKNWIANCTSISLGSYKNEIDAAIAYDKASFVIFGKNTSNNKLVKYEDTIDLKIEDIKPLIKNKKLPLYITKTKKNIIQNGLIL